MIILTGIICLLYYSIICLYVGRWKSTFSRFWIVCGLSAIGYEILKAWIPLFWFPFVWVSFWIVTGLISVRIILFGNQKMVREVDYLIVLGAKVDRTRITGSLRLRLDKAYEYAACHERSRIIVSGGQGQGEDIPEAKAMADYLIRRGIKSERILLEDSSSTTAENLRFTAQIVPDIKNRTVGVVTNSFHIYRACLLAKQEGYKYLFPVSAKSEKVLFCNYIIREAFAVVFLSMKYWTNRH